MRAESSATAPRAIAPGRATGLWLASLGVLTFSMSLPATVFALDGLDPYLVGVGRAVIAALLAAVALVAARAPLPRRRQLGRLATVGGGVVFGFPVLSSLALDHGSSSAHAAVVVGVLPALTAVLAVLRAGERPSVAFWLASAAGTACVTGFTLARGAGHFTPADLLLFAALLTCAIGYAEGGRLTREMPGWQIISWALVLSAPISMPWAGWLLATTAPHWTGRSLAGFAYVSAFSMFLGFFAWYAGMARVGVARASQTQLAQPILTLVWSGIFLNELIDGGTALAALAVLLSVALTQRARVRGTVPVGPPEPAGELVAVGKRPSGCEDDHPAGAS